MEGRIAYLRDADADAAMAGRPRVVRLWQGDCVPRVTGADPATLVITDFSREKPWTVTEERSIGDALRDMVCAGIRSLLVVRADAVCGLVTSYDIERQRLLELQRTSGCIDSGTMQVGQIMTDRYRVPMLDWGRVCGSRMRQLEEWIRMEEWLRNTRVSHALIIERRDGVAFVRGLLSRTRVERSLGRSIYGGVRK